MTRYGFRLGIMGLSVASLLVAGLVGPASADLVTMSSEFEAAFVSSAADNQAYEGNNQSSSGGVDCDVLPKDRTEGAYPTFRGSGSGTPQSGEGVTLRQATDRSTFTATCEDMSSPDFTMTANYYYEAFNSTSGWSQIPNSSFTCEGERPDLEPVVILVSHMTTGGVPPTCDSEKVLPENDPSLNRPHRLHLVLTTSSGNRIEGVSRPWLQVCTSPSCDPAVKRKPLETACDEFLPTAPPAVLDSDTDVFRYWVEPNVVGNRVFTSPVTAQVSLEITNPLNAVVQGTFAQGTPGSAGWIEFALPAISENVLVSYSIDVNASYAGNELECSTSASPLLFMMSSESPTTAMSLPIDVRRNIVKAAVAAVNQAAVTRGQVLSTEEQLLAFCEEEFEAPTPCDWAPGEDHTTATTASPAAPVTEEIIVSSSTLDETEGCKTLRKDAISQAWWGYFSDETPDSGALWVSSGYYNRHTDENSAALLDLFSDVAGGVTGGETRTTRGSIGYRGVFSSPSNPSRIFVVQPTLRYRLQYKLDATAGGPPSPFFAGTKAVSSIEVTASADDLGDSIPEDKTVRGIVHRDEITAEDPAGAVHPGERFVAGTISTPLLALQHNDEHREYLSGTVSVHAQSLLGGAYGSSDAETRNDPVEGEVNRFISVDFVDLTLVNPDDYWANPNSGGTCVA